MIAFWLVLFLLQSCGGFTARGVYNPERTDLFELSVIHINDFHARFDETGPASGVCHAVNGTDCVGGLARMSTVVQKLMKRPNAIFLNAGDNYQGTLWYNVHRWNVTVDLMNMLPHDVLTIGNHEFDDGVSGVIPFLKKINAPVVVTNIDDSEEPSLKGLYKNSTIIERNGTKIGIIGVILSTTDEIANTEKLKFLDEVVTVNEEAAKLKAQGINIIMVLSHCGLPVDEIMAAKCPEVDVIVGGHSHTFLYTGTPPFTDVPEGKYPVVVTQEDTNRTVLIVQAAAFAKYVGNLSVWFDEEGEVVDWDGNPVFLENSIEKDPDIVKALLPWKKDVDEIAFEYIGATKVFLNYWCTPNSCNLGYLVTDAMVEAYVEKAETDKAWTYAAIACSNRGGVRASIEESSGGSITYADLMMVHPFGNTWDTIELRGSTIRQILVTRKPLIWSGMKITYNLTESGMHIPVEVKVRCRVCEIPKYEDLVDEEWYRIVVPSFLLEGGDGYEAFLEEGRNRRGGSLDIDGLMQYVKKRSPIIAGQDRRMLHIR